MNKRGQATIWIIVAVVLIASSAVIFVLLDRNQINIIPKPLEPRSFIEQCTRDAVLEAEELMLPQGGFISPDNYKYYNDYKVEYLCETIGNYKTCINQHPMLLNEMKQEIESYITPIAEDCFETLEDEIRRRGEGIQLGSQEMEVNFGPGRIYITLNRSTRITKGDETSRIDSYDIEVSSPLYDLANVGIEIAADESKYCYFEYAGYMTLHPENRISVFQYSDSTAIYTIKEKRSNKEMNIAIRSCAIPPGF